MKIFQRMSSISVSIVIIAIVLAGGSCKKRLTQEMAFDKIQSLSEVQEYMIQLKENGTQSYIRQEPFDRQPSLMEFSVGESHPTHTITWKRFSVDSTNGNISVFDVELGEFVPIEQWRKKK